MFNKKQYIPLVLVLAGQSVHAGGIDLPMAIGVGARTFIGLGPELTVGLYPTFNARAGFGSLDRSYDETIDGINYKGDIEMGGLYAFADWFPFENGFRLSGGFVQSRNEVVGRANITNPVTVGNFVVNPGDVEGLDTHIDFTGFSPYLGIGWGNAVAKHKGFSFAADLGVIFSGSPDIRLEEVGSSIIPEEDLQRELDAVKKDAEEFDLLPVLGFSMNYAF